MRKRYLILSASLFLLGFVGGYLLPFSAPDTASFLYNFIRGSVLEKIGNQVTPGFSLSLLIFLNNIRVALVSLALSITILGPLLVAMGNGAILGLVASVTILNGRSPIIVAASILPHGALEIPALVYVVSISLELGLALWDKILKGLGDELSLALKNAPRELMIAFLLFLFAAIVEGLITPYVVLWVQNIL
ncbi:MAG: stage II sporulation protein M [Infirmifilum sp.]